MQSHSKLAVTGLFATLTVSLGVFETFIAMPVPGVRLGLSNIGIMLCLYLLDLPAAFYVALAKSILVPFAHRKPAGENVDQPPLNHRRNPCDGDIHLYHIKAYNSGLRRLAGGFIHIAVQFFVVKNLYIKTDAIYNLLPYFTFVSVLTGAVTGYITLLVLKNFPKIEGYT